MRQRQQTRTLATKMSASRKRAWFLTRKNSLIEELDEDEVPSKSTESGSEPEAQESKKTLCDSF